MPDPDMAPIPVEKDMERLDLPEEDRDEVRRFVEVLRRRKARRDGEALPPLSEEMKSWLLGEDDAHA